MTQPIYERAAAQLEFIRETMSSAAAFTAVPGLALMLIGATAVATWGLHDVFALDTNERLFTWMLNALVALPIGLLGMHLKGKRLQLTVWRGPGRRFLAALAPSGVAAAGLTFALFEAGMQSLVCAVWLLTYGVGVMAAGAYSIRPVPVMGALFLAIGVLELLAPNASSNWMVAAFGGVHLVFGYVIWKHHGG